LPYLYALAVHQKPTELQFFNVGSAALSCYSVARCQGRRRLRFSVLVLAPQKRVSSAPAGCAASVLSSSSEAAAWGGQGGASAGLPALFLTSDKTIAMD